ncbi:hypothetical protein FB45DRAFT_924200 [Roridomyces roridus]|uniref:Uncharacterized protein n=1 Tax=Roridomyces roridus TaxID=1738132 RepID=A0AAD7BLP0_9AGAR|nr:hypothetical protein FB45DRAFT_924200 [Roridomyces roridus]
MGTQQVVSLAHTGPSVGPLRGLLSESSRADHLSIDLSEWIAGQETYYESSDAPVVGSTVTEEHIQASAVPDHLNPSHWSIDIQLPLWDFTWILKGWIDRSTLQMEATFSVKITSRSLSYLNSTYPLARVKENLKNGIPISFGIWGIVSGKARFYLSGGWLSGLWLNVALSASSLGVDHGPVVVPLLELPKENVLGWPFT